MVGFVGELCTFQDRTPPPNAMVTVTPWKRDVSRIKIKVKMEQ